MDKVKDFTTQAQLFMHYLWESLTSIEVVKLTGDTWSWICGKELTSFEYSLDEDIVHLTELRSQDLNFSV